MAYIFLTIAFIFNSIANILLKVASTKGIVFEGVQLSFIARHWELVLGLFLFVVNVAFYFLALRSLPVSVAYPIMVAMSFIIVNGTALVLLRESITVPQIIGYICIVFGLTLVVWFSR